MIHKCNPKSLALKLVDVIVDSLCKLYSTGKLTM